MNTTATVLYKKKNKDLNGSVQGWHKYQSNKGGGNGLATNAMMNVPVRCINQKHFKVKAEQNRRHDLETEGRWYKNEVYEKEMVQATKQSREVTK